MKQKPTPKAGWQTVAELNLPVHTASESRVQEWMMKTMSNCGVDQELLKRMIKSALEVISRVANSNHQDVKIPMVHLCVYTPIGIPIQPDLKRNWGFFRIDKHGLPSPEGDPADHMIEFFLYLEDPISF